MIVDKKSIQSGIYLVIDPAMKERILMEKLTVILAKDIAAVQIWDNFKEGKDYVPLIRRIHTLCIKHQTPLLINNQWEYLREIELEGIHFDNIPSQLEEIKNSIKRDLIIGLTCGNELNQVRWAAKQGMDYISFCSMFPSTSARNCEIVDFKVIQEASTLFKQPLFLAGGINTKNISQLDQLKYNGIAVISGIMDAEHPDQIIDEYRKNLKLTK